MFIELVQTKLYLGFIKRQSTRFLSNLSPIISKDTYFSLPLVMDTQSFALAVWDKLMENVIGLAKISDGREPQ